MAQKFAKINQSLVQPHIIDEGVPQTANLGLTGLTTGLTALEAPQKGETIVASAATGTVGNIVAQLAKYEGAKVIGVAGRNLF